MKKKIIIALSVLIASGAIACAGIVNPFYVKVTEAPLPVPPWRENRVITNDNYLVYTDEYDIIKDTTPLGGAQSRYYSKYIEYTAPNGKPIRIVAMNEVTDDQMLYAYDLLCFFLNGKDTYDKTEIANRMADNESILILPNGADRDGKTPMAAMALGQNLNQAEIANIGSNWYMGNDFEHRDAAFEEIFHMVHDYGIGTTKNPQASPEISQIIAKATANALPENESDWGEKGLWGLESKSWLKELSREGSLEQEYIASVIDSYYGLWEPWTDGNGGMWGLYVARTRAEIAEKDPTGLKALEFFLPAAIDRMMRVDSGFTGDFNMNRKDDQTYTYKSQYLKNIYLSGGNDSNILGNDMDNILMGNSGRNSIDGGPGEDVLQLRGALKDYVIETVDGETTVKDSVEGRDGVNVLTDVEVIRAMDADYSLREE